MSDRPFAWVTHAPADYMLVFRNEQEGDHAVVTARFATETECLAAGRRLKGAELVDLDLRVYCTLPGEADAVVAEIGDAAEAVGIERGTVAFVGVGGSPTNMEAASRRRDVAARVVISAAGDGPRQYAFDGQCRACGEFYGKIRVLPQGGVMLDTRRLSCRCDSIPCRYCEEGTVRRPLSEHFDPERRAGSMPWFGYLVPCGSCQAEGRGPRVQMST